MPSCYTNFVEVIGEVAVDNVVDHYAWVDSEEESDESSVCVKFESQSEPPLDLTLALSKKFPDAEIYHSFEEDINDNCGVAFFTGGVGKVYRVPLCRPDQVHIEGRVGELLSDTLAYNWKCKECMDEDAYEALKHNEDGILVCEKCYEGETPWEDLECKLEEVTVEYTELR